jgi:hypothetical protein
MNLLYKTIKHSSINGTSLLNDLINCIILLFLLVEFCHFNRNTDNLKHFYYDVLAEFCNIILATKQSFIPFIVIRFVNIWDPTMCASTECTFNMVCELA